MRFLVLVLGLCGILFSCTESKSDLYVNGYEFSLPKSARLLKKDKFLLQSSNSKLQRITSFQAPLYNAYSLLHSTIYINICTGADSAVIDRALTANFRDDSGYIDLKQHEYMIRDADSYLGIKFYNLSAGNKYLILITSKKKNEVIELLHYNYFTAKP